MPCSAIYFSVTQDALFCGSCTHSFELERQGESHRLGCRRPEVMAKHGRPVPILTARQNYHSPCGTTAKLHSQRGP